MKNTYILFVLLFLFSCVLQGMESNVNMPDACGEEKQRNALRKLQRVKSASSLVRVPLSNVLFNAPVVAKSTVIQQNAEQSPLEKLRLSIKKKKAKEVESVLQKNSDIDINARVTSAAAPLFLYAVQRYIRTLEQLQHSQEILKLLVKYKGSEIDLSAENKKGVSAFATIASSQVARKDLFLDELLTSPQLQAQIMVTSKKALNDNNNFQPLSRQQRYDSLRRTRSSIFSRELPKGTQSVKVSFALSSTQKAFFKSVSECDVATFQRLLPQIEDINFHDPKTGNTVLMQAVQGACKSEKREVKGDKKGPAFSDWGPIFSVLIQNQSIDIYRTNAKGQTAITIAQKYTGEKALIVLDTLIKVGSLNSVLQ